MIDRPHAVRAKSWRKIQMASFSKAVVTEPANTRGVVGSDRLVVMHTSTTRESVWCQSQAVFGLK